LGDYPSECLIRRQPAAAQRAGLHHASDHVQAQFVLGSEAHVCRDTALLPPLGERRVIDPGLGQVQPPVEQRRALIAGIAQKDARLTIGPLAELPTILALHTDRFAPFFREVAAIQQQDTVIVAERRVDFLPVLTQDAVIVPGARIDKGLQGTHVLLVRPVQGDGHRFHRLALQVEQQAMQVGQGPCALFAPLKQRAIDGVVVAQLIHQVGHILRCQVKYWHRWQRFGHRHGILRKQCGFADHDTIGNSRCSIRLTI
jgi:hypothetical protein